jgi:hypothetical protein
MKLKRWIRRSGMGHFRWSAELFHNWMSRLTWVIERGREYIIEPRQNAFLVCSESQNRKGCQRLSLHLVYCWYLSPETVSIYFGGTQYQIWPSAYHRLDDRFTAIAQQICCSPLSCPLSGAAGSFHLYPGEEHRWHWLPEWNALPFCSGDIWRVRRVQVHFRGFDLVAGQPAHRRHIFCICYISFTFIFSSYSSSYSCWSFCFSCWHDLQQNGTNRRLSFSDKHLLIAQCLKQFCAVHWPPCQRTRDRTAVCATTSKPDFLIEKDRSDTNIGRPVND